MSSFNKQYNYSDLLPLEASQALDNTLIRQKDYILALVNRRNYREALVTLHCVRELWIACNYGYKWDEILTRIKNERPINRTTKAESPTKERNGRVTRSYGTTTSNDFGDAVDRTNDFGDY